MSVFLLCGCVCRVCVLFVTHVCYWIVSHGLSVSWFCVSVLTLCMHDLVVCFKCMYIYNGTNVSICIVHKV